MTKKVKLSINSISLLMLFCFSVSCEQSEIETSELKQYNAQTQVNITANAEAGSPWYFSTELNDHYVQADNDGNNAHNWSESNYANDPVDNGFDIRDYAWESSGKLYFKCPSGNGARRAEFRGTKNRELWGYNRLRFTCTLTGVPNDEKVIIAQMHNDSDDVSRPYITVYINNNQIYVEQSNNHDGSGSTTTDNPIAYNPGDEYEVQISTSRKTFRVTARVTNIDNGDMVQEKWFRSGDWRDYDGEFYYKFGVYMPNGGSDNTTCIVTELDVS